MDNLRDSTKGTDRYRIVGVLAKAADDASGQWAAIVEGYASTRDVDRGNDVVEPSAFEKYMPQFMDNPVVLFNHNTMIPAIGNVLNYKIDSYGLWVRLGISSATQMGREVAASIKSNILRTFSFMYRTTDEERGTNGSPNTLRELMPYEFSIVNIPMNPNAKIAFAKSQEIYNNHNSYGKGQKKMDPELKKEIEAAEARAKTAALAEFEKTYKPVENGAKVDQLKGEIDALNTLTADLKRMHAEGTKTSGEMRTTIDKMSKDLEDATKKLTEAQAKASVANRTYLGDFGIVDTKSLIDSEPQALKELFGDGSREHTLAKRLQTLNDQVYMVDFVRQIQSREKGKTYHTLPLTERIKDLKCNQQLQAVAKALDTAQSSGGTEYVPTVMSGRLNEKVRLAYRIAALFDEIPMDSPVYLLPVEGADSIATLMDQTTSVVTSLDSTENDPGTAQATLTAKKGRVRIQVSRELTEDSIIPILPYIEKKLTLGIVRAVERALFNGDTSATHFDTNESVASDDFRRAWKGLRYFWYNAIKSSKGVDVSTFSFVNCLKIIAGLDRFAQNPQSDLAWICSTRTYWEMILALDEVKTVQNFGPGASVVTGQINNLAGIPIIMSEFVQENLGTGGINDATAIDRSILMLVNRQAFVRGALRPVTVDFVDNRISDITTGVAFIRHAFTPLETVHATNSPSVNAGFNVTFG